MSKLDRLADKWVAEGHFSSHDEVATEVEIAMEQRLSARACAQQLEAEIRGAVDELDAGGGTGYKDRDAQLQAIKQRTIGRDST